MKRGTKVNCLISAKRPMTLGDQCHDTLTCNTGLYHLSAVNYVACHDNKISVCDREKARSTRESLRIARPLLLSGMKRYRFQSRGKIRPDVSVVLQDVGFPFSHSYSSQREWQRWREGAKSGGEMVEVVERENVGITFGRRIMFMLPSSC